MRPDGPILLIDESYNANPASVRAALAAMATTPREDFPRRVAVLGDMLELGEASADLHRGLKEAVDAAGVDLVLACGPMMKAAARRPRDRRSRAPGRRLRRSWCRPLLDAVRAGDVVMIKGSLASAWRRWWQALLARCSDGRRQGPRRGGMECFTRW